MGKERRTRRRRQNAEWKQLKDQMAEEKTRGPLDTKEARRERKENVERKKVGRQDAERSWEKERWQEDFLTAYQATQRRRLEYNGEKGPLDVYDRKWTRLLMLYCVKVGVTLDPYPPCWHWQDE